ncbi:MAG: double zinc ribbon domain-containing protein [candidate division WOR-3 bacterium]
MKRINIGNPLEILFPENCIVCKNERFLNDIPICRNCFMRLKKVGGNLCSICGVNIEKSEILCSKCKEGRYFFDYVRSVYYYDRITSTIIKNFKYNNIKSLGSFISNSLYMKIQEDSNFECVESITYIPQSFFKSYNRYFNQSFLLAKDLSELTGIPLVCNIIKQKETLINQAILPGFLREKRSKMFYPVKKDFKCGSILLVDDVFTTGKTLSEAAKVLKEYYRIEKVFGITFARS